jgi:RecJ-like exonuclease
MRDCPYCGGSGIDGMDGGQCPYCDGTGEINHDGYQNDADFDDYDIDDMFDDQFEYDTNYDYCVNEEQLEYLDCELCPYFNTICPHI